VLIVRGLSRSFREGERLHRVLAGLDVEIAQGETVAIVGRSGSGKSTLLNLICGIDRPDSGTIEIAGETITAMSERQRTLFRRRHLGFVYQFFNLIPTLDVEENVRLALELNGIRGAGARQRIGVALPVLEAAADTRLGELTGAILVPRPRRGRPRHRLQHPVLHARLLEPASQFTAFKLVIGDELVYEGFDFRIERSGSRRRTTPSRAHCRDAEQKNRREPGQMA